LAGGAASVITVGVPDRSLLRHPPFALFLSARVCTSFAFQMQSVAIGWQVYALTGSALDLGLIGLAQFLPVMLLTLAVGHVADRYDRRRIAAICQVIEFATSATLTLGVAGGWLGLNGILGLVTLLGASRAFEAPTLSALMPGLVEPSELQLASAWSASANQAATIVGPAAGGLLYAFAPPIPFGLAAALFLLSAILVSLIRVKRPVPVRETASVRSVLSGITFIWTHPAMLGAISLDLFAVLLGGATALLPIYARDILHTGSWGLGVLRAAPAVGALLTSIVLARRPLRRHAGRVMFGAVILFGVATIVFGLSRSLPVSIAALVLLGSADVVSVVIRFTLVQMRTPDNMRGRVSAVNMLFIGASNQLGEFESGVTAALLGAVPATLLGGAATIGVAILWMWWFPELRDVDELR
jgi:MFS family permease